ncbi:MAG: flagellar hook protein FlgE [Rhodomicrobiaceae bacterium]
MSISALMRTSASGMDAQSNRLGTVADNIANVNTTGYKRASAEFSSFIPQRSTNDYVSGSVTTTIRKAISEQGNLSYTTSATDLAVSGNGFFLVNNADGSTFLSRAGSFVKNGEGELVNAAGYYLMGYSLAGGPPAIVANGTAGLERVTISNLALEATQSTEGVFYANLPADAPIVAPADLPSLNLATSVYTAKTSLVATADLGRQVTLDIYWAKTAADTWEVSVYDRAEQAPAGEFPYSAGPLVTDTITFDGSTGALDPLSPTDITIPVPGGSPLLLDLSQSSQLATDYIVSDAFVNGNAPSAVERTEIDDEGVVYAVYENGARVPTYQIPLANVVSPDRLTPLLGDVYTTSAESGAIQIGFATQGGLGGITSSALEQSNVDLANELTNMIEAERHYAVNSKVFQTGADLLDVIVNLKR